MNEMTNTHTRIKEERNEKMSSMKIDHDAIRKLAALLDETGLSEIEISDDDNRIRVAKGGGVQHYAVAPSTTAPAAATSAASGGNVAALSAENHPGAVKSPMVGTAYLQAEPGSPRFMTKGSKIKPGDTLLIIEAMKVMNPIKAEKGGTVVDILVDDAQPVEFGQPLVIIE
jgi:acetyl-CoA carboxylase biotin carboxyl carrier protein